MHLISSLITKGIANNMNPINRELIAYIFVVNKLDKTVAAAIKPIAQPIPILIKKISASFLLFKFPLNRLSNEFIKLSLNCLEYFEKNGELSEIQAK